MARKKDHDYFAMMAEGVSYACKAAEKLNEDLKDFDPSKLRDNMDEMHEIEHAADVAKHDMIQKLLKEFITSIDREDIMELASAIDDVTDSLEDVLLRIYMYNIMYLRKETYGFLDIIIESLSEMELMMKEFPNFRKSKTISDSIIKINRLEEEGDRLFAQAVHELCSTSDDPIEIMAWTRIYDQLEKCCDLCEDVANAVERVILTNS